VKTAISLPDELFSTVEKVAKRLGLSRSQLYRKALRRFIAEHNDSAITEALDAIYSAEPKEARVDPVLARLQAASMGTPDEW